MIASAPITTDETIGVPKRGLIVHSFEPAGRLLSRLIAKARRIAAACTASAQTMTAMTTATRMTEPPSGPSTARMRFWRPPRLEKAGSLRSGADMSANSRISPPSRNEKNSARRIAFGAFFRGSCDSSASELAVSNPYMTYSEANMATRKAPA